LQIEDEPVDEAAQRGRQDTPAPVEEQGGTDYYEKVEERKGALNPSGQKNQNRYGCNVEQNLDPGKPGRMSDPFDAPCPKNSKQKRNTDKNVERMEAGPVVSIPPAALRGDYEQQEENC